MSARAEGRVALRAPTLEDVPAAVAMMNERGLALHGEPELTEEELRGWFTLPSMSVEHDIRIALDATGTVVGYADLGDHGEDGTRFWIDLRTHPVRADTAVTVPLLDAMEARARERAVPDAVVRAVADEVDERYRRLLAGRGYRIVRASYRMSAVFGRPPPEPQLPAGITVRTYRPGEEDKAVHAAVTDAFSEGWDFMPKPFDEFLHWTTTANSDPTLCWVAEDGEQLAGVCLCRPTAQGDETRGWVETLGVLRPWRGRGLGRALLLTAFREFHRRGRAGAALAVDTENVTGAVRLYESVGMRVARRLDIYERPLRG